MAIQNVLVMLIAAGAVLYLCRAAWRTWAGAGCAKGCGCGPKGEPARELIAAEELLVRVRPESGRQLRETQGGKDSGNSENFSA